MKKKVLFNLALLVITASLCKAQTFYGVTNKGGSNNKGAIISFNATTNKDSVVWSFGSGTDGASPYGNLVYDTNNGLFYGMTYYGGSDSAGTIFTFNLTNNTEKAVWNFGIGTDGAHPHGDLVYDAGNGLFYGMTYDGGNDGEHGIIFSFNPTNNTESVLWNFGPIPDGQNPYGNLVYDADSGLFYGLTSNGGTTEFGAIISFNPTTNKESVVLNLAVKALDGNSPYGNLIYNAADKLFYGMTFYGGSGSNEFGAIINFNPATNKDSVLWSFGYGTDGSEPVADLVYDAGNGLYYGTTFYGGTKSLGTIISFNPVNDSEKVVWNFGSGTDGSQPKGNLVYNTSNGLFYGLTYNGGMDSLGTIFSFNPTNNAESVVWNFKSKTDGANPYGSLVLYAPLTGINQLSVNSEQLTIYPNPTSGQFTINLKDNQTNYSVEVYNVIGEQVYQSVFNNSQNIINLSSQPEGMYFVYLKSQQAVGMGKVMITK